MKQLPSDAVLAVGIDVYTNKLNRLNAPRLNNIINYLIQSDVDSFRIEGLLYNTYDIAPPFPGQKAMKYKPTNDITIEIEYNMMDYIQRRKNTRTE